MGRMPLSAMNTKKALSHVYFEREEFTQSDNLRTELQSESSSPVLEPLEVCPQNSEIITQPPEKVALQLQSVTELIKPTSSKGKLSKYTDIVRRSKRLQSLNVQPIVEDHLTASQGQDKDSPPARERKNTAGSPLKKYSYGGKLDYLVELLEVQGNAIKELSSKVFENSDSNQRQFAPDVKYKSLYIESQKKIDALTEEKRELTQKLEIALIKVEACERGTQFAMDFLDKLKDLVLIANFPRPPMQQTALTQAVWKDLSLQATTSSAKNKKRQLARP